MNDYKNYSLDELKLQIDNTGLPRENFREIFEELMDRLRECGVDEELIQMYIFLYED